MNYRDYSVSDFAADAYFQKWVQNPDINTTVFWEQWLLQNPDKKIVVEQAIKLLATFRFQENAYSQDFINNIWRNIEEKIEDTNNVKPLYASKKNFSIKNIIRFRHVAAIFLVLVLAAVLFNKLSTPPLISHSTPSGQIKTILLPDSSLVTLNANSRLLYRQSWSTLKLREVWLEGEGYFQVRKKPVPTASSSGIKFIVHVNLMDIEVLGTKFNVNTRRGKAQVVLNSGKVKLSSQQDNNLVSTYMMPGDLVERTSRTGGFFKKVVDPNLYSSWKTQHFVFKTTTMAEIVAVLEDTYGWEIQLKNPKVGQMTFTSTVPVNKPDVLLRLLAESFKIDIQKEGNKVVIGN
ncbi:FecR family protein [Adhaeribacter radiodurans]|uniref:FecR family protein n=1 Tax=Adhaeribacter radiodurans TaxID=2745197 RepID=A0A7L7L8D9_9BACT|nr:FecR family protein [Adhaeribacter radiodurans]QMU29058.1 FecR family protein [Adhaeribacter radiodurans]